MWNDPKYTLAAAQARQREIARDIDAVRAKPRPATDLDDVIAVWVIAVRTTGEYVRSARLV